MALSYVREKVILQHYYLIFKAYQWYNDEHR